MPKCPACNREVNTLVTHHWFELPNMERHEKQICIGCNGALTSSRFFPEDYFQEHKAELDHVLPSWDEQVKFIRKPLTFDLPGLIRYRTYDIIPELCDDDDSTYYRVELGFENTEDAKRCLDKWIDNGDIEEGFWTWET